MSDEVRLSFQKWDAQGRGAILKDELTGLLRRLDPNTTDEELNALLSAAQVNHDGSISYERFLAWLFCDVPDVFGQLGIEEFNVAATSKCLWDIALSAAVADAGRQQPKAKVDAYFSDVRKKIAGPTFTDSVRWGFFERFVKIQPKRATFEDVVDLIDNAFVQTLVKPTRNDIRVAFDAIDAQAGSRGWLDADGFIDLVRYFQVQVASATLREAEARAAQNLKQIQVDKEMREKGLWKEAIIIAKAKACQRFNETAVETYFEEVDTRLTGEAYAKHVTGVVFAKVDTNKDGKVSFDEALQLIRSTLQCAADLAGAQKPTAEAIREVFDAHDTMAQGWDFMGGDEFLNLMRYLQVQVADAMLPLSELINKR